MNVPLVVFQKYDPTKKKHSFSPQLLSGWCQPKSRFQIGNSSIRTCLLKTSWNVLRNRTRWWLNHPIWKIFKSKWVEDMDLPEVEVEVKWTSSCFIIFQTYSQPTQQPNNPTQPHLGKPPACSGSQPSNLKPSPQMEGAKDPGIGSHFDIQKVETLSSKALPQKKKTCFFFGESPSIPTFRQL